MQDQCVADDKWKAVTDGMWYTIVPVRARTPGAAVQADKEQTAALPEGEPHAELDTKSLASSNLFNLVNIPAHAVSVHIPWEVFDLLFRPRITPPVA